MAVAVWVRVLLPQILGSSAALSSAAVSVGKGGNGASATQPQQPAQQPHQLSEASAAKAFQYLDGLLGSPAVKRDMHLGVVVRYQWHPSFGMRLLLDEYTCTSVIAMDCGACSLRSAARRDCLCVWASRENEAPMPLVLPESLVALLQAAHDRGRLQGNTASLARSHQVPPQLGLS